MIYEYRGSWWNDIDREKPKKKKRRRKTCSSATVSTTNPTRIDPGMNSGFHGERLVTNCLSHGTAVMDLK
jgi:hypothetical protein